MNILFVINYDPRDVSSGSAQRSNFIWKMLMKQGTVYTVCLFDGKSTYLDEYEGHPIYHHVVDMTWRQRMLEFPNTVMSYFCQIPLAPVYPSLRGVLGKVWPDVKFDIIFGRYVLFAAKYHLWSLGKAIIDIDDHPAEVYRTVHRPSLKPIFRPIGDLLNKMSIKYVFNRIGGGMFPMLTSYPCVHQACVGYPTYRRCHRMNTSPVVSCVPTC